MENAEADKSSSSVDISILSRNRSFKAKQLVRSQAIRESQSPPRALSPYKLAEAAGATNSTKPEARSSSAASSTTDKISLHSCGSNDKSSSDAKVHIEDQKKKQAVEIQITLGESSGGSEQRQRSRRRWLDNAHFDLSRDLLSNQPRILCVCGACAACATCRSRRWMQLYNSKQESCSEEYTDCRNDQVAGTSNNGAMRKSASLDVEDRTCGCRCSERKDRPKDICRSNQESDEKDDMSKPDIVIFIKNTLNKSPRDRMTLLKIEKELHSLVNDTGRCIMRFPVMTSYGRMLVHRCAELFQLSHHLDQNNKTCVLVSKSGTSGGSLPCTNFKEWCIANFPTSPQKHQPSQAAHTKSILKRDTHSLDEPETGTLASNRSKSLEQREREYERVRRRIFSSDDCAQQDESWPWMNPGPVKLLMPDGNRHKLLKVQSLETSESGSKGSNWRARSSVSKSHSFGGYGTENQPQRVLSKQGDLASSSWRLSPSSSGYKTLSLRSTDSITPSPTGGASPEPAPERVVWCVSDVSAVPAGAVLIHPQTGRLLTNPDGSVYHFDPAHPPVLCDPAATTDQMEQSNEKRRGRLEKQHSFMDNECEYKALEACPTEGCLEQDGCHCNPSSAATVQCTSSPVKHQERNSQNPSSEKAPKQQPEPTDHVNSHSDNQNKSVDGAASNRNHSNNAPGQELQQYSQGCKTDEMQASNQFTQAIAVKPTMHQQAALAPISDPNIHSTSEPNVVGYQAAVAPGYSYLQFLDQQFHVEPPSYPQGYQAAEEAKAVATTNTTENRFRIDPSYPFPPMDYTAACACGAANETNALNQHRSFSTVPYGQMEVAQAMPPYQAGGMLLPQPHMQAYQYQEPMQWGGMAPAPKIMVPDTYPYVQYQAGPYQQAPYPYNIYYHQIMAHPYPVYQAVYPAGRGVANQPLQRIAGGSAAGPRPWAAVYGTPVNHTTQGETVQPGSYENNETPMMRDLARSLKQLQVKSESSAEKEKEQWRKNNGVGLLGNYPNSHAKSNHEELPYPEVQAFISPFSNKRAGRSGNSIYNADCWSNRLDGRTEQWRPRDDGDAARQSNATVAGDQAYSRLQHELVKQQVPQRVWRQQSTAPVQQVVNSRWPGPRYPHN